MNGMLYGMLCGVIVTLSVLTIFTSPYVTVFAVELNSIDSNANNFSSELKSKISNLISSALNDSSANATNASSLLTNGSNLTSSQIIISKSKVLSTTNSNGSNDDSTTIKNKVKTINGVCNSEKVGGNGNDTLASSGNCNDQMTGGPSADKFTCAEGNDTIRDYNPQEGDVILDQQNCEKIL
jgi:hypothetical protein